MLQVLVAIVIFLGSVWYFKYRHPKGFPNGPRWPLPLIGDAYVVGSDIIVGFHHLREKYGDIYGLFLGPERTVVVNDFASIQEMSNHEDFIDRPDIFGKIQGVYCSNGTLPGLIFSNGQNWSEQRRFALHGLRDFGFGKRDMEDIIDDQVNQLCSILEKTQSKPMNVNGVFNISVVNALWTITTGQALAHNDSKINRINQYLSRIDELSASPLLLVGFMFPLFMRLMALLGVVDVKETFAQMSQVAHDAVQEHKDTFDPNSIRDFVDAHLKKQMDPQSGVSFQGQDGELNAEGVLADLFLAGSSTISMTLTWSVLFMANNPEIQTRVQKEIHEVTAGGRIPTGEERHQMPFTEAVIQEIQRRANIVPNSLPRMAVRDSHFKGHFIPKGTQIMPNIGEVLMDPKVFPNPKKFDPSRFLDGSGNYVQHPMVIPFGVGKRRCLGETLARVELFKFFTGILGRFTVERHSEAMLSEECMISSSNKPIPFLVLFVPLV